MYILPRATFRGRLTRLLSSFSLVLLLAFLLPGCAKDALVISPVPAPVPIPIPINPIPIHLYPIQRPFQTFVKTYNVPITNNSESIGLSAGDFDTYTRSGTYTYSAAELGFAFRSSVAGAILGLGTMLPVTGFAHTVTLWDSATQVVLASVAVTNQSVSVFTYANFATSVSIRANHGYVIGYNSLAIGNPVNTSSNGNEIYLVSGILVDGGAGGNLPLFPFTQGNITVENAFEYNYGDGPPPTNLFPMASNWSSQPNGFFGLCDVDFVQ